MQRPRVFEQARALSMLCMYVHLVVCIHKDKGLNTGMHTPICRADHRICQVGRSIKLTHVLLFIVCDYIDSCIYRRTAHCEFCEIYYNRLHCVLKLLK